MIDQILLNNTDSIEIDVYYNGALTEAENIRISQITDPDGVTRLTDGDVTEGSTTGRYSFNVPASITDKLGIYQATWAFTINETDFEHVQSFEVVSVIRAGYTTVQQFRSQSVYDLVTSDYPSDSLIQKHIDRATLLIDRYLMGSVEYAQHTETRRCVLNKKRNGLFIQLTRRPIVALTSVTLTMTPNTTITLSKDNFRINAEAGYIEYLYDVSMPNALSACLPIRDTSIVPQATVSYTAGYTAIPNEITQAAIMLTEELLKVTFDDSSRSINSVTINKDKITFSDNIEVRRAKELLGLDNAIGVVNLLKQYRNHRTIIAGPLG